MASDVAVIKAEEIKSILYLGARGVHLVEPEEQHSIDTFA